MSIRRQTINLLQIFCEISLHSQVIFKSMKVADDILRGTLECECVKKLANILQSLLVCVALGSTKGLEGIHTEELMVLCMYDKKSRVKRETLLHVELRSQS